MPSSCIKEELLEEVDLATVFFLSAFEAHELLHNL
jgi:hypothetical protein